MEFDGFKACTLDDLAIFRNGKSLSNEFYTPYGKFPVFGANGQIARSDQLLNRDPVVVIGRVGAYCGSTYYIGEPSWVTDNAIIAQSKEGVDCRFLYYRLLALDLRRTAVGSAQPLMTQGGLKIVRTVAPPLPEQRSIAHILGTLDDKIELNRRMNETLEAMVRAIFKSWFVDFDPVRAKAEGRKPVGMSAETAKLFPDSFGDSELGEIPKGWRAGCLGDIAENPRRGIQPSEIAAGSAYIGLEHMPRKSIALSEWATVDEVGSNKFAFRGGEILFGKLRPYFHKVGVAVLNGVCSTDILVIREKKPGWFGYILFCVSSGAFVDYTDAHSSGTKMPRTNWKDMSSYELALPPFKLAETFNWIVTPLVKAITSNILQSRTLASIRDALLPNLLSGEIRVKDVEKYVGEVV